MVGDAADPYGAVHDAALAVADGRIVWLGKEASLPSGMTADEEIDGAGGWLTPGLIDCHTHLVYAGNRAGEFERRLNGESYESIARSGGGIRAPVAATRAADEATLYTQSRKRLQTMLTEGVTTVEIKSGYGLDLASERKMLRVARQLAGEGAALALVDIDGAALQAAARATEAGACSPWAMPMCRNSCQPACMTTSSVRRPWRS